MSATSRTSSILWIVLFCVLGASAGFLGISNLVKGPAKAKAPVADQTKYTINWSSRPPGGESFGDTQRNMQANMGNVAYSRGEPLIDGNTVRFTDWNTGATRVITGWSINAFKE